MKETKPKSIGLAWENSIEKANYFQVRYSPRDGGQTWTFAKDSFKKNFATITGLMANTEYIFQVRGVYGDQEGQFGPESDTICTNVSSARVFLEESKLQKKSNPSKYLLPVQENTSARNVKARTRQLYIGKFVIFEVIFVCCIIRKIKRKLKCK